MKNLEAFQHEFVDKIKPIDLLENAKPLTTSGLFFKDSWLKFLKNEGKFNFTLANKFLSEAYKLSNDAEINKLYKIVYEAFNENRFKSVISLVAESTAYMSESSVNDIMRKRVNDVLGCNENEVQSKLRNGYLDNFANTLNITELIKETRKNDKVVKTNESKVYHPISYVETNENFAYFRVGRYVFRTNENVFETTNIPSERFKYLSDIVEFADFNYEKETFTFNTEFGKFNIAENGIKQDIGEGELIKLTTEEFINKSKVVIESKYASVGSRPKLEMNSRLADAIVSISENIEEIADLDNFYVIETKHMNEKILIGKPNKNSIVAVESSKRYPAGIKQFKTLSEAIKEVHKLTGVDVSENFEADLIKESDVSAKFSKKISKQKVFIESLEKELTEISESFKTVERGSEAYSKLEEAYDTTYAVILEAKSNLTNMMKNVSEAGKLQELSSHKDAKFAKGDKVLYNGKESIVQYVQGKGGEVVKNKKGDPMYMVGSSVKSSGQAASESELKFADK